MKKVLGAHAILVLIALVFTGCGDKATVFRATNDDGISYVFSFDKDGSWTYYMNGSAEGITFNLTLMKGTYTGNPKQDGSLNLTQTHGASINWNNITEDTTSITNELFPLVAITPSEFTLTISNGRITTSTIVFTRQ